MFLEAKKPNKQKISFLFFLIVYSFKTSVHIHMKMTKNIPLLIFNSDNEFYVSSFFYLVYICSLWWSDAGYVKYLAGLKSVGIFIYALSFLNFVQFFSVKTHRREISFLFKHFSKEDIITLQPPNWCFDRHKNPWLWEYNWNICKLRSHESALRKRAVRDQWIGRSHWQNISI